MELKHHCLNCGGSGWYDSRRQWGCFRCGGLQYPSRQGTGIDPLSDALCILESVLNTWTPVQEVVTRTMELTKWTRKRAASYLNWMYKKGMVVIDNGKAIDRCKWLLEVEEEEQDYDEC